MPRISIDGAGSANVLALDMLAYSEIGSEILADSDDGYDVLVGSLPGAPKTFNDYSCHPLRPARPFSTSRG